LTHDIEEFNKTNKRVVRFINIGFTERWDIRRLFSIDKKP